MTPKAGTRTRDKVVRKEAARIFDRVVAAKVFLETVDQALIEDLIHRQECGPEPDGLPTNPTANGGGGSEDWTPTERAALNEFVPEDKVGQSIDTALSTLEESCAGLAVAKRHIIVVLNTSSKFRARQPAGGNCRRCGEYSPKLPRGLDPKCYQAWYRLPIPRPQVTDWLQSERAKQTAVTAATGIEEAEPKTTGWSRSDAISDALANGRARGFYEDEAAEIDRLRDAGELPPERPAHERMN